jgi:hypothetical protein
MVLTLPGRQNSLQPAPVPPPFPNGNARALIGGAPVNPIARLRIFSSQEFEVFTYEWVHYALKTQYREVQILGGAGDQGRDVIGWKDSAGVNPRRWDNYQCKHYAQKITPTDFWLELGKLCYYTFLREFTAPDNYYIVSPCGVGTKLNNLLAKPEDLKKGLIANWDAKCKTSITETGPVDLAGDLRTHIETFDFSIFREIPPLEILDQHRAACPTHALIFGGELKQRPAPLVPPSLISPSETRYVQQLYSVYSEHLGSAVTHPTHLASDKLLERHFHHSRKCFYCAESLKEFARDNLPGHDHFLDLAEQIHDGILPTLYDQHPTSFSRLTKVCETALSLQITSNILTNDLKPSDRTGICHQLANEDRVNWTIND